VCTLTGAERRKRKGKDGQVIFFFYKREGEKEGDLRGRKRVYCALIAVRGKRKRDNLFDLTRRSEGEKIKDLSKKGD